MTTDERIALLSLGREICRCVASPTFTRCNDLLVATEQVFELLGVIPRAAESPIEPDGITVAYFERHGAIDVWSDEFDAVRDRFRHGGGG